MTVLWGYSQAQLNYAERLRDALAPAFHKAANDCPHLQEPIEQILRVRFAGWWIGLCLKYFNGKTKNADPGKVLILVEAWDYLKEGPCSSCGHTRVLDPESDPEAWNPQHDPWLVEEAIKVDEARKTKRYFERNI